MIKHKNRREPAPVNIAAAGEPPAPDSRTPPYHAEEMSFTTRMGGPDIGFLMTDYINGYALSTGAALLSVHHIPANNTFLFIWETP